VSKRFKLGILVIAAFMIVYLYASPYWVLYQLKQAIENNDHAQVSSFIDHSRVRQSLKQQLAEHILHKLYLSSPDLNAYKPLERIFADSMADHVAKLLLSPQAMSMLLKTPAQPHSAAQPPPEANPLASELKANTHFDLHYQLGYSSLNVFQLSIFLNIDQQPKPIKILLQRQGLSWKIVAVILPDAIHHHFIQ
jgi:hypothetical protein